MASRVPLSTDTPFERSVLDSKLRALGASGFEDESELSRSHLFGSQVRQRDLQPGPLTIGTLDGVEAGSRWFGLKTIPVDRGDPTAALAAITDHLQKLSLAEQMLRSIVSAVRPNAVHRLVAVLERVSDGLAQVDTDDVRAHLTAEQAKTMVESHQRLLEAYGEAVPGLREMTMRLGTKAAMTAFSDLMRHYGRMLERAPLFLAHGAEEPQSRAMEILLDGKETHREIDRMNRAHPTADSDARAEALLPLFDLPAFKQLGREERNDWMEGLATVPQDELAAQAAVLRELLSIADVGRLSVEERRLLVDRLTSHPIADQPALLTEAMRAGSAPFEELIRHETRHLGLSAEERERFDGLLERASGQMAYQAPPIDYEMPRRDELAGLARTVREQNERIAALSGERSELHARWEAEREAVPGYAEWKVWKAELDRIDNEIDPHQNLLDKARRLKRRWERHGRHETWRDNTGVVWLYHDQFRREATVKAPRVIRDETDALIELKAERLAHLRTGDWADFEATHVKPIDDRYTDQIRTELREARALVDGAHRTAKEIFTGAFEEAHQHWMKDRFRDRRPFDQRFITAHTKSLRLARDLREASLASIRYASKDLGIFDDRRPHRSVCRARIEVQLAELQIVTGRLPGESKIAVEQRTIWEAVREAAEQYHSETAAV